MALRYYCSDVEAEVGDHVIYAGEAFVVEMVFEAGTSSAKDYSCFETGGILISGPNTFVLYPPGAEDLDFVSRK